MLSHSVKCLTQNYHNSTQIKRIKAAEASSLNSKGPCVCSVLRYTKATARNPINGVTIPVPVYTVPLPLSPSHSIQINVGADNRAIILASSKCFGLVNMHQRRLERTITVDRDENATNHSQDFFPCAQYNKWLEIRHPLIHNGSGGKCFLYMTSKVL